jgi:LSD1 subclass zinc finger protein
MNAHSFNCPSCSAPLVFRRRAFTIRCAYCGADSVVPQQIRQAIGAAEWTTLVSDNFDSNDNNWLLGQLPSEYFSRLAREMADGRYRWQATVRQANSFASAWLLGYPASDFQLTARCQHRSKAFGGSSCGPLFRIQDNENFYWFRMTSNRYFTISAVKNGKWKPLVDWTKTDTINPHGVNELEVIAEESYMTFSINKQIVGETRDDTFSAGLTGLAIEGYTAGQEIAVDFLDFTLKI